MEIPSTSSEVGFFYPSDFDDDLEFVVGIDKLFVMFWVAETHCCHILEY